jgi:hypothetical protein
VLPFPPKLSLGTRYSVTHRYELRGGANIGQLPSSKNLTWIPCGEYTCAKLEVPLDYEDENAGTTAIAFKKWSAAKQPAKEILFNPGTCPIQLHRE